MYFGRHGRHVGVVVLGYLEEQTRYIICTATCILQDTETLVNKVSVFFRDLKQISAQC